MANNYWALVFRNKVVEVFTEAPKGEYHDAFSIITTSEKPIYGQDVIDGALGPVIEPVVIPPTEVIETPAPVPTLTSEEIAKALADGQAALDLSNSNLTLEPGPNHIL